MRSPIGPFRSLGRPQQTSEMRRHGASKSGTTSGRAHCCALHWRHEMIAASGSGHGRITVAVSSGHGLRMTVRLPQPGQPTPPHRQGVYPPTPTGLQLRTRGFRSSSMSWRNHDPVRHADRPSELPAPRPGPGCEADVPVIPVHATRRTCASARCLDVHPPVAMTILRLSKIAATMERYRRCRRRRPRRCPSASATSSKRGFCETRCRTLPEYGHERGPSR